MSGHTFELGTPELELSVFGKFYLRKAETMDLLQVSACVQQPSLRRAHLESDLDSQQDVDDHTIHRKVHYKSLTFHGTVRLRVFDKSSRRGALVAASQEWAQECSVVELPDVVSSPSSFLVGLGSLADIVVPLAVSTCTCLASGIQGRIPPLGSLPTSNG